jgi:hypothetical protein
MLAIETNPIPQESIMVRRAFPAEVTNGQLRFQESLADLEGRRVMVVLNECEAASNQPPQLVPDARVIDEMEIEKDVSFRMPFRWEPVKAAYREAADDDRALAEAGMSDYTRILDSDVMLDAWCELPRPPVIGRVTPRLVEQLPFDIPHIPTEEDVA